MFMTPTPLTDALKQQQIAFPDETESALEKSMPYVRITEFYPPTQRKLADNAARQLNGCDFLYVDFGPVGTALYRRRSHLAWRPITSAHQPQPMPKLPTLSELL